MIDFLIVVLAATFPWSTAVATGLLVAILPMLCVTHGYREIIEQLRRPACALPLALVVIAIAGVAWAEGVPWSQRVHAIEKVAKLLWFAPLFLHFQKTRRARLIFATYVGSNLVLLAVSFVMFADPSLWGAVTGKEVGVPVKNYIDQSQGFSFIALVCVAFAAECITGARMREAIAWGATSAAFIGNLVVVNVARTAFFYVPAMLLVIGTRYARGWQLVLAVSGSCILAAGLWATSPNLQMKMSRLLREFDAFQTNNVMVGDYTAGGAERLEMWRKSIGFMRSAPIIGHGTGSTRTLFAAAAEGKTGLRGEVVENPHNQTLATGVQWGGVGCVLLYAMWCAHFYMFHRSVGPPRFRLLALIGCLAVVQNVTSSVFNSHLFDFYEGWLYVLSVTLVGGQMRRMRSEGSDDR
ncbi:O-antigen ligase family protein [Bradyrhizobium sp. HKCCYLS2038]|uniref:O-antigen ligase family protein n=1 Tax=unclassified Bradyrhizobium TaxID=2631580 RepID=UPI003EBBDC3E